MGRVNVNSTAETEEIEQSGRPDWSPSVRFEGRAEELGRRLMFGWGCERPRFYFDHNGALVVATNQLDCDRVFTSRDGERPPQL